MDSLSQFADVWHRLQQVKPPSKPAPTLGRATLSSGRQPVATKETIPSAEWAELRQQVAGLAVAAAQHCGEDGKPLLRLAAELHRPVLHWKERLELEQQVEMLLMMQPTPELSDVQQSYVEAGAIWLKYKELHGDEATKAGAHKAAEQLGWEGTQHKFKLHSHEGTKPDKPWLPLAQETAVGMKIPT